MIRPLALAATLLCLASPSVAQGTNIDLGGIAPAPDAPVEISADNLNVDQEAGTAVFTGNVVIGQGDLRLAAGRVEVTYSDTAGEISRLTASGGVTFAAPDAAAEASDAVYNLEGDELTLSGDVLVTQGATAITADRMVVDLNTGAAQAFGRVRTVLQTGQN